MGNSLPTNQYISVGTNARYRFSRECRSLEEGKLETSMVSYYIGASILLQLIILEKTYGKDGNIKLFQFKFYEPGLITLLVDRAENNLLNEINMDNFGKSYGTNCVNEIKNGPGGVTKTNIAYRVSENWGSLLVVEQTRKSRVEKPCAVTMAHYFAISKSNFLIPPKMCEVGLSIVVDIRVLNNDLDVSWKGPSEHPSLPLLNMFQQVSRTRTWKWTACPRSAYETQRRQHTVVSGQQFETESDDEERNYLQWPIQIGGNILANQGTVTGNNNGNFFVNQLILRIG